MGADFRIILGVGLVFSCIMPFKAQQDPMFNKYMFNPLYVNPAYAGSREAFSAVLVHRSQWVGFDGAPTTQTLSAHMPLAQQKMGLGFQVSRDEIGPTLSHAIQASYAYRIKLGYGKLSFGLRGGFYNYQFAWNKITLKDQEPNFSTQNTLNYWSPNVDFGVRYHDRVKFAGLTLSHLNPQKMSSALSDTQQVYSVRPHIKIQAGYAFEISEHMVFKPSVFAHGSTQGNYTVDVNASILMNRVLWAGVSYRSTKALVAMIQYDVNNTWSLGYSYDYNLGPLRNASSGSHEVFVRFEFLRRLSPVLSPRYF